MKRTQNKSLQILLIDDNSLTSLLMLRFFAYLKHNVTFADKPNRLNALEQNFDLIMINLACPFHEHWIIQCIQGLNRGVPVISYAPDFLIHDFNWAQLNATQKLVNDGWMLNSKFFEFINGFIFRSDIKPNDFLLKRIQ